MKVIKIILIIIIFLGLGFLYMDFYHSPKVIKSQLIEVIDNKYAYRAPGLVIQAVYGDSIWASRGYTLYKSNDGGATFVRQFKVPTPLNIHNILSRSRIARNHFVRHEMIEFVKTHHGTYLVFSGGTIYRSADKGGNFYRVHNLKYHGYKVGRGVMPLGITIDNNNNIYYGDYGRNINKDTVAIYRSVDDGKTWERFYSYPPGYIRHIHSVQYDRYTDKVWATTGDSDTASTIGYFKSAESDITVALSGGPMYCPVSLVFTESKVYWGSDKPSQQNYICSFNRETGKVDLLVEIDGPVYYSTILKDGTIVKATSVDGGRGEWDNKSTVWITDDGLKWNKYLAIKKRKGRGVNANSRFPRGEEPDRLILNFLNTVNYHKDILIFKN